MTSAEVMGHVEADESVVVEDSVRVVESAIVPFVEEAVGLTILSAASISMSEQSISRSVLLDATEGAGRLLQGVSMSELIDFLEEQHDISP